LAITNEQKNCQWRIARRPKGNVVAEDFLYHEEEIPILQDNEILLRTLYLNLAPVMRMYMSGESIAGEKGLDIGDVIHGRGVAEVIKSNNSNYKPGEILQGQIGWQTFKSTEVTERERFRKINNCGLPFSIGLSTLGMTGLSAYFGLLACGKPKKNETIVVSGAAGGVGSTVIQIAKMIGCRVIGLAGNQAKCDLIKELGCDEAINYRTEDIRQTLSNLCQNGIDIYFDNVGGDILSASLDHLAQNSRIVLCGSISEYLHDKPYGLDNYTKLRRTNSCMQGFFIYNYSAQFDAAEKDLSSWLKERKIKPVEHIYDGFENMPKALSSIYDGGNYGVALSRIRHGLNDDE